MSASSSGATLWQVLHIGGQSTTVRRLDCIVSTMLGMERSMRFIWLILGAIALILGIIWTLQGLNILGGSVMSGDTTFVIVGPIIGIVGLILVFIGIRQGRAPAA
jgi:hypothetical protein